MSCCPAPTKIPTSRIRTNHFSRRILPVLPLVPAPIWVRVSSSERAMSAISASARSAGRMCRIMVRASSVRPCAISQRGDSGMRSIPMKSASAGRAQTANIHRHTLSCSPQRLPMMAFTMNAASCPPTTMSSLRPESDPRIS